MGEHVKNLFKLKGFFTKAFIEEETKGSKQAAYEPAGDITDKDDKASKVPQELWQQIRT